MHTAIEMLKTRKYNGITIWNKGDIIKIKNTDYSYYEMLIYDGIKYSYITTDKQEFCDREDAVGHQIKLLEGEYNG